MLQIDGLRHISTPLPACALSLGNFDGVHIGHQAILAKLLRYAGTEDLPSVLLTFDPHPQQILQPEKPFQRLFPVFDLAEQVDRFGLDYLVVEPFTQKLAALPPARFLTDFIKPKLNPKYFVVGHDFAFGSNRSGTLEFLGQWCKDNGADLWVQPPVALRKERVSSRRIRELVSEGEVYGAAKMLGRLFYVGGTVEKGAGRGRLLGVPTINFKPLKGVLLPKRGVYATTTVVRDQSFRSVSNLGLNPTFVANGELTLETHILDFEDDLYGENVQIQFIRHLRGEMKFSSPFELVAQIQDDIKKARSVKEPTI